MRLILHDLLEEWNSGSYRNFFDWISLDDMLDGLKLVWSDVAVEFVFILQRFLIFHLVDLTACWADGFAAEVLKGIQHVVIVLNI